ncbi:MAG TPA: methylthioribulose 1-phosphate dehydratase [Xanthomonadaceae bacterium]|nr:methylthioribulose 1-phosphate dehydratase [Xanthomonadaceae bacterium]
MTGAAVTTSLEAAAQALCPAVRALAARGWTPATSSNFSLRLDQNQAAITVSGRDKSQLAPADLMVVDFDGHAVGTDLTPSAETVLHTRLYRQHPEIGCVLHTHSQVQTVASRLFARRGHVRIEGYELLKAFPSHNTHEASIDVPVLPNTQNMQVLADLVEDCLTRDTALYGYLIDGHGLYAWGRDLAEAQCHLEAFDFLLGCELELRRYR